MENKLLNDLSENLNLLIGQKCWSIIAGKGAGSIITIDFGKKIKRNIPLTNKNLTEEQRKFEGKFSFLIWCAWRLDSENDVICGSTDSNVKDGPMLKGLSYLIGHSVESIKIFYPAYDLIIKFNGNLSLKLFCDQTNIYEKYDNYSFFISNKIYTIEARGHIKVENRRIKGK